MRVCLQALAWAPLVGGISCARGAQARACIREETKRKLVYDKQTTRSRVGSFQKEGKYYVAQCLNVDVSSLGKTKKETLFCVGKSKHSLHSLSESGYRDALSDLADYVIERGFGF